MLGASSRPLLFLFGFFSPLPQVQGSGKRISNILHVLFGSAARRGDIYLFLPVIIDLTPDNLDINSARGEYLRECPPAAHQLCMNYALCHMFYGLNRYFQ